jgi:hypothetical protein
VTGNVYPEIEKLLPQYPHRSPRLVFRNMGQGAFEAVSARSGAAADAHSSRGAAFGDIDNDGDLDVLIVNMNEPPSLLRNDVSAGRGWIELALQGVRSNRSAIGAIVVISANGVKQARTVLSQSSYYSHDDLRLHFGLGERQIVDRIDVHWPAGGVETLTNVPGQRLVTIKEGNGEIRGPK